jgi:Flp pilus assembly protein TadD
MVILATLLVGAIVATVHGPVLRAQARSLDDAQFVTYNPLVTHPGWASTRRFFGEVLKPSTVKGYYLPLSMTSLMLDYAMGGRSENLFVFHRTSLALHALATMLLVVTLFRLFGALVPAALAGLLFGLHPLTVEPVAWVSERKTLLAALFAFGSVLCYVEHRRRMRVGWRIAAVALYGLALLSKPTVTMLPLLLLLLDFWPLRRLDRAAVIEKWPFFLLTLASGVVTLVSHQRTAGIVGSAQSDVMRWPLQAGYLLAFYLRKIVVPTNLSCVYPPPVPFTLANPAVLVGAAVTCSLTILLAVLARRARGPLAGWLVFAVALAPTLGLVQYSWVIASDKYVYFPALGILLALASGLTVAWNSRRPGAGRAVAFLAVLATLVAEARGTRAALRNWTDSLTLALHMEKVAPGSPVVHNQLGVILGERGARDESIRHLRRAVELMPDYGVARYNLGIALMNAGQVPEAIVQFRRATERMPDQADAAYNLGMALTLGGSLDEAAASYRRALQLDPNHAMAPGQLGRVLLARGRTAEAVEPLRRAVTLDPGNPGLHFQLSVALLFGARNPAEAAGHLRQAITLKPDWPDPCNTLAWILATSPDSTLRDPRQALELAARAVELTRGANPAVLDTRAAAEAAAGRFHVAATTARRALDLARQSGSDSLANGIRDRLRLYERGSAYVDRTLDSRGS